MMAHKPHNPATVTGLSSEELGEAILDELRKAKVGSDAEVKTERESLEPPLSASAYEDAAEQARLAEEKRLEEKARKVAQKKSETDKKAAPKMMQPKTVPLIQPQVVLSKVAAEEKRADRTESRDAKKETAPAVAVAKTSATKRSGRSSALVMGLMGVLAIVAAAGAWTYHKRSATVADAPPPPATVAAPAPTETEGAVGITSSPPRPVEPPPAIAAALGEPTAAAAPAPAPVEEPKPTPHAKGTTKRVAAAPPAEEPKAEPKAKPEPKAQKPDAPKTAAAAPPPEEPKKPAAAPPPPAGTSVDAILQQQLKGAL